MPGETINFPNEAACVKRFGVHIVRRQVIAPLHNQSGKITVFTCHPVERFNGAHHGHIRQQCVVAMHQQLGPRPIHGHRLDRFAIPRQTSVIDNAARLQQRDRFAIAQFVELYR